MLSSEVYNIVVKRLPSWYSVTQATVEELIKSALIRLHALYVDNDLSFYNPTEQIYFYHATQNDFINIRNLTRWVGITPPNFEAVKLISCMLKEANPDFVEYPTGVSYIQDIDISIGDSGTANITVPSANSGLCTLRNRTKLFNVLTLGLTNSWTNLNNITALLTYYRDVTLPTFAEGEEFDAPAKDIELIVQYVISSIYEPYFVPMKTKSDIQRIELAML